MGKIKDHLDENQRRFIAEQHLFFTATAPREGRINVSPKGIDTFRCLDERSAAYLDLTGSGNETAAHLQEDPRLTIMFCSFDAKPRILRLYGKGRIILPDTEDWQALYPSFPDLLGARQLVHLTIESVQTSCGFGVPLMEYQGQRPDLIRWAEKKGEDGLQDYRQRKNTVSLDGLPIPR